MLDEPGEGTPPGPTWTRSGRARGPVSPPQAGAALRPGSSHRLPQTTSPSAAKQSRGQPRGLGGEDSNSYQRRPSFPSGAHPSPWAQEGHGSQVSNQMEETLKVQAAPMNSSLQVPTFAPGPEPGCLLPLSPCAQPRHSNLPSHSSKPVSPIHNEQSPRQAFFPYTYPQCSRSCWHLCPHI